MVSQEVKQVERALHERELQTNLTTDFLDGVLEGFPDNESLVAGLFDLREKSGLIDIKRGELYPEVISYASQLRKTIAQIYEVDLVQAQPNFGCNGCIDSFLAYIQRLELSEKNYDGFLAAVPTYFRYYHKAQAMGFNLIGVPFNNDNSYPLEQVLSTIKKKKISFLLLVSPNNPTGVPITDSELEVLLSETADDLIIAIDRTCVNTDAEISTKALLKNYDKKKLVVFHSFSKYHGLSHQRIGFSLVSNPSFAGELDKYLPFGLNLHAVLSALTILLNEGELKPYDKILRNIATNQEIMKRFLKENPDYDCTDFKSNYAILTIPESVTTEEFYARLIKKGISVMPGHELPEIEKRTIRIHCGGPPGYFELLTREIESWRV